MFLGKSVYWTVLDLYPLLNIGQMIEFLIDYKKKDDFSRLLKYGDDVLFHKEDFCDVLWEAVKETLKTEKQL